MPAIEIDARALGPMFDARGPAAVQDFIRERITADLYRVHDRDIVYGPWLEGTSERNRTTRFRGYAAFRKGMQRVNARLDALTSYALRRCIERLGGGA